MIVDTSALLAVLLGEPRADEIEHLIRTSSDAQISAPTSVEFTAVLQRLARAEVHGRAERLLSEWGVRIAPFDERHAARARLAYREYGRGSGHRARLNLGDCFSYALAIVRDEPLLFVGDDFVHTDVRSALPQP